MISKTTDAKPLLSAIERAKIERELERSELAQKIACAKGFHPIQQPNQKTCGFCNARIGV